MKNVISLIMVIALFAAVTVPSFNASELISEYQTVSSSVTYDNPSNYRVVIPETIDGNADSFVLTAESMNIRNTEQLMVCLSEDYVELTCVEAPANKARFCFMNPDCSYERVVGRFYMGELTSNITSYPVVENARDIPAGEYTGTANFVVKLIDKD